MSLSRNVAASTVAALSLPEDGSVDPASPSLSSPRAPSRPAPTSSSLFKVLEASADVIPAFLDWTKDCGKETETPDPARPLAVGPRPPGLGWGHSPLPAGSQGQQGGN